MSNNNRIPQIDIIKSISALAVFFIHYAGIYLQTFDNYNSNYLTPIRNLCFFAVPVFFITSGFLHAGKNYSYKDILPKIIYFFFLTVITNFAFTVLNEYIRYNNYELTLFQLFRDSLFLKLMPHSHLWFMVSLLVLYLFIPIFSQVEPSNIFILTIITTMFSFFRPHFFASLNFPFPLPYYFSYFLIGYSIKYLLDSKKNMVLNIILIVSFILFLICMVVRTGPNKFDYNHPLVFFLSLSIFLSLLFIRINNQHLINIFREISIASLGIYISHPIFIHFIFTYKKIRLSLPIFWAFFPILFSINVIFIIFIKKLINTLQTRISKIN